jgi:hypothetical protein
VDDFLKVLVPLAWQLRLDVYDAAKGVYLPVFHTPVPQEAGSRYLLEYYPQVATRDLMLDAMQYYGIQEILGDANTVPKPGRQNKLFVPMPLPFLSHLSREGDLLLVDSKEKCFCHTRLVRDRYIWRLQGPLEEHGFVLKRRNLGCFKFLRNKGKQSISTTEGGCSSIYLSSHSKRMNDIFIKHLGREAPEESATISLTLGEVRRFCVPSWKVVAEPFSLYGLPERYINIRDDYINREISMSVTSYEEIDWLAEDLLRYGVPMMNEVLTVNGVDNLYNKKWRSGEFFHYYLGKKPFVAISCALIYARLAGNPEFDDISDEIEQFLSGRDHEYYQKLREFHADLLDVCKKHLHPLDKDAPA